MYAACKSLLYRRDRDWRRAYPVARAVVYHPPGLVRSTALVSPAKHAHVAVWQWNGTITIDGG